MWELREKDDDLSGQDALFFALGAVGGFALGVLLSGRARPDAVRGLSERATSGMREMGTGLRDRAAGLRERTSGLRGRAAGFREAARGAAAQLSPSRLRRPVLENSELASLEDAVLDAFLADDLLSQRGIDVGAISRGIVELSGSVNTHDEAERAVRVAQRVDGVDTVVNRMEVEEDARRLHPRDDDEAEADAEEATEWTGRNVGMGRRRQGRQTDPSRSDDSRHFRDMAMKNADHRQFEEEGLAASQPRVSARPEAERPGSQPNYREDQLDNQDPYAGPGVSKHGARPQPEQPQQLNTQSRVGEGMKPGTELALEASDVPVKPHGDPAGREGRGDDKA